MTTSTILDKHIVMKLTFKSPDGEIQITAMEKGGVEYGFAEFILTVDQAIELVEALNNVIRSVSGDRNGSS